MKIIFEFISPQDLKNCIDQKDLEKLKQLVNSLKEKRNQEPGSEYSKYSKAIGLLTGIINEIQQKNALETLIQANLEY